MHSTFGTLLTIPDKDQAHKNLLLATWKVVTSEESGQFGQMVSEQAAIIASNIAKSLAFFCATIGPSSMIKDAEHWGQSVEDWSTRMKVLKATIGRCVKIKARLPLRQTAFQLYLPSPGERFDPITMQPVGREANSCEEELLVLLCVAPAIFSTSLQQSGTTDTGELIRQFTECISLLDCAPSASIVVSRAHVIVY